ncbi:MAG TPA: protein kinase [Longimicrobiales bacterium]|nr:protein kinase [Longimicrobiales bacterium]
MPDTFERLKSALSERYAIQRELGQGGMATVWLATDLRHHRDVALKVLRPELAAAVGPERFLREIDLAARLTHPHILPVHDSGEAAGLLYYVMPYVEGESLRERLKREKQLPVDEALRISREVADALSYAHAHGVIHRDIKPENILLEAGHAVVADFGIAKAIEQAGGAGLTGTGVALGTPAYVSPEQAAGSKDLDGRSDLYSLACVLFEMLAGRPPFVASSPESVVYQHLAAPPPPITSFRPAVPAQVAATLERALAKVPADRFNPVALFSEALGPGGTTGVGAAAAPRAAFPRSWRTAALLTAAAVVVAMGLVAGAPWLRRFASGPAELAHPRTAIAVLPLQNLSGEGPYAYFAGGLHDELLTQLSKVAALSVRGRTSVMGYAGTSKQIPVIAEELSVGTIVEGSVQVVGDRLRVNVQLIDAATDEHLWAERYDRALDDAFAVQSEIAERIAAAVGATLSAAETAALAAVPTQNPEAYRFYLQGLEYQRRPGGQRQTLETAQALFERALASDSTFALAYAALAEVHGRMSFLRHDPSPERLVRQRVAAEAALQLEPDLPQAHAAMGHVHYYQERDWRAALDDYRAALKGLPNDAELWGRIGFTHRRLGEWNEALACIGRVVTLDPRDSDALYDLGGLTMAFLRRYPEAVDFSQRAYELTPDAPVSEVRRAWAWVMWQGRLDSLAVALARLPQGADLGSQGTLDYWHARRLLLARQPDSLLALLDRSPRDAFAMQMEYEPPALYAAWAHRLRGNEAAARTAFESARAHLDSVLAALPDDYRLHASSGLALAGLGRRREAAEEVRWLQEQPDFLAPYGGGGSYARDALILAQIGDVEGALKALERLLSGPSLMVSAHTVRLDPRYDPIRNDPRFQALLAKYAEPKPVW